MPPRTPQPSPPEQRPDRQAVIDRLRAAGCVFAEEEADLLLAAVGRVQASSGTAAAGGEAAVAAEPTEPPASGQPSLTDLVARRVAGEPLEHLLGWVSFAGLRLAVAPGVFVPRRRTELLAREAAALARPGAVVVDLCCGCGAVGAAVRASLPDIALHAVDIDAAAVGCARRNLPGASVYRGDLLGPLPPALHGRIDVIAANVPYVPSDAIALMPPEARDHEPRVALDGGMDGLDVARRVAATAPEWLAAGGHLLIETSTEQEPALRATLVHSGLTVRTVEDDDIAGTVVIATAPPATARTHGR